MCHVNRWKLGLLLAGCAIAGWGCASDTKSAAAAASEPARRPVPVPEGIGDVAALTKDWVEFAVFDVARPVGAVLDDVLEEALPRNMVSSVAVVGGETWVVSGVFVDADSPLVRLGVVYELRPESGGAGCRVRVRTHPKWPGSMGVGKALPLERTIRQGYHEEIGFFDNEKPPAMVVAKAEKSVVLRAAAIALIRDGNLIKVCNAQIGIVGDLLAYSPKVWVRARDGDCEVRVYSGVGGAAGRRQLARAILRAVEELQRAPKGG